MSLGVSGASIFITLPDHLMLSMSAESHVVLLQAC